MILVARNLCCRVCVVVLVDALVHLIRIFQPLESGKVGRN